MPRERSRSKPKQADKTENNPYVKNLNLNKLNRLISKEKILINEAEIKSRENVNSKKPSSAEELIKEAEKEKNRIAPMPIISDKSIKKPIIFPSANGNLNKIGGPKLITKKDQEHNSFSLNNNNLLIEDNFDIKTSNKIIFKQTSISSNPLNLIESKISHNSTLTKFKLNSNNNSFLDSSTNNSAPNNINIGNNQKAILINKLNNTNSTINSGKVNFNNKINLSNFNNNNETERTNNTSVITQNSSIKNNQTCENFLNTSSTNSPNNIIKNLSTPHHRINSNFSSDSSNTIFNNMASPNGSNINSNKNNLEENSKLNVDEIKNKYKTSSNNDAIRAEALKLNNDQGGFNKNFDSEKILINNKINDVNNIRINISLKKPAIMGAAYGNSSNSKTLLKTKSDITNNNKK
jgi:hypothetical protein